MAPSKLQVSPNMNQTVRKSISQLPISCGYIWKGQIISVEHTPQWFLQHAAAAAQSRCRERRPQKSCDRDRADVACPANTASPGQRVPVSEAEEQITASVRIWPTSSTAAMSAAVPWSTLFNQTPVFIMYKRQKIIRRRQTIHIINILVYVLRFAR